MQAYLDYYSRVLRPETNGATPLTTNLRCFFAYTTEKEGRRQDAVNEAYSAKPQFTIDLKRYDHPRDNEVVLCKYIASRLGALLNEQYEGGETTSYLKAQLDELWDKYPDYRNASKEAVSRIEPLWKAASQSILQSKDGFLRANETVSLIWQTYHCLVADHHPLTPEESARKTVQLQMLDKVLEELDSEVVRQKADLPEEILEAIRAEAQRCITRLNEYSGSPAYPLLYYPLHDDAFEKAINSIETKVQIDIHMFLEGYSARRKKLLEDAVQNARKEDEHIDFFQNMLRKPSELQGKALIALTMGNIMRHYCIVDRNLDYNDPTMFPFWKVNGISVVYRMQEGLSTELDIDWKVRMPAPSDK